MTQQEFNKHYRDFLMGDKTGDLRSIMRLKGITKDMFNEMINGAIGDNRKIVSPDTNKEKKMT